MAIVAFSFIAVATTAPDSFFDYSDLTDQIGTFDMTLEGSSAKDSTGAEGQANGSLFWTTYTLGNYLHNDDLDYSDGARAYTTCYKKVRVDWLGNCYEIFMDSDDDGAHKIVLNYNAETTWRLLSDNAWHQQTNSMVEGEWYWVCLQVNSTHRAVKVNGTDVIIEASTNNLETAGHPPAFNGGNEGGLYACNIKVDKQCFWDSAIPADEQSAESLEENCALALPSTPNFVPPTPADGHINNTNQIINVTCAVGQVRIYFDNNSDPNTLVSDEGALFGNYTTKENVSDTYYYKATCNDGVSNSTARSLILDFAFPIITLEPTNFVNVYNESNIKSHNISSLPINITFTDNRDLYYYLINLSLPNGTEYFSINGTINDTLFNYNTSLTINSSWLKNSEYLLDVWVADAHTNENIGDYKPKKIANAVEFDTTEGNNIIIETEDLSEVTATKEGDRYTIDIDFDDNKTKNRDIYLRSDKPIDYLPSSIYDAHFVIFDKATFTGNWVDFEGTGAEYTVSKIDDYNYMISFKDLKDKVKLKSIGGLNILHRTFSWYLGDYDVWQDDALSQFPSTVYLNISKGGAMTDINVSAVFNNTNWRELTMVESGDYLLYSAIIDGYDVQADSTYPLRWEVNVTQPNTALIRYNVTTSYKIFSWFIDDGTLANFTAFDVKVYDETTNALMIANLTISLTYYFEGFPAVTKNYQDSFTGNDTYSFFKSVNSSLIGDQLFIVSAAGFGTRNINHYDQDLEGVFKVYLLPDTATTDFITFTLVDSASTEVIGANMKIFRIINASTTLIFEGQSDFAGQITSFLDQLYNYDFIINASGFPIKEFNLQPVQTAYTIRLTLNGTPYYDNPYDGIRYKVLPRGTLFNNSGTWQNITFIVEGSDLEEIGINLTNHDYLCNPVDCSQVLLTTTGGSVTVSLFLNHTGTFNTAFYFKRIGEEKIFVNDGMPKVVDEIFEGVNSLVHFLYELKQNTSPNTRTFILGVINIIAVGIGASLGLFGSLLLVPIILVNIIAGILPLSYNGVSVNLVHPLISLIMVIFSAGLYILSQMRQ